MSNKKELKLAISCSIVAVISLFSVYLIPVSLDTWSNKKEYLKLTDGFTIFAYVPAILLAGITIFSLLKKSIAMFICSLSYVIFTGTVISFTLKNSEPCFGLTIIVLEMILILRLAILQLKNTLTIQNKDINIELIGNENLLIKGKKKGTMLTSVIFIIIIILGAILFLIGCDLTGSYSTVSSGQVCIILSVILIINSIMGLLHYRSCIIFITDKRVSGKLLFNKIIDLPLDSITGISNIPIFHGITVTTPSKKIKFYCLQNSKDVYSTICKLLIERQSSNSI